MTRLLLCLGIVGLISACSLNWPPQEQLVSGGSNTPTSEPTIYSIPEDDLYIVGSEDDTTSYLFKNTTQLRVEPDSLFNSIAGNSLTGELLIGGSTRTPELDYWAINSPVPRIFANPYPGESSKITALSFNEKEEFHSTGTHSSVRVRRAATTAAFYLGDNGSSVDLTCLDAYGSTSSSVTVVEGTAYVAGNCITDTANILGYWVIPPESTGLSIDITPVSTTTLFDSDTATGIATNGSYLYIVGYGLNPSRVIVAKMWILPIDGGPITALEATGPSMAFAVFYDSNRDNIYIAGASGASNPELSEYSNTTYWINNFTPPIVVEPNLLSAAFAITVTNNWIYLGGMHALTEMDPSTAAYWKKPINGNSFTRHDLFNGTTSRARTTITGMWWASPN